MDNPSKLQDFFSKIEGFEPDDMVKLVEKYLTDEDIDVFIDHIENFYGIEDDEELGHLAQIMVTGFLAAKESMTLN